MLFVSLGLGSVVASALEVAPWLMTAGRHKGAIFIAVGAMLAVNYRLVIVRPRRAACAPGEVCHIDSPSMRAGRAVFWLSVAIYVLSVASAYGSAWWVRSQI
jgi:hypothetical protein